jgi:hypothetical protein
MRIFNWTRADGTPTREWCRDDMRGTHVPLPLDASAVPDAVVERVAITTFGKGWGCLSPSGRAEFRETARAAIAALAQALGEEG